MKTIACRVGSIVVAVCLLVSCSEPAPGSDTSGGPTTTIATDCSGSKLLDCARRSTLGSLVPAKPTRATGTPIKLGMVNQENTPVGSFPELSQADQAAIRFVNEQLGGVDGHPLELEVCNTNFSAEGSTACGQRFVDEKLPVVLGGIDVFGNAIDTLRDNGVPYVGGIPVSTQSATSPNSFQFSGGIWGATVAFSEYATSTLHAKRIAILYGEFGSITQAAQFGEKVLTSRGVKVQMVPYPILATDITSPLQAAMSAKPEAIFVLAADTGCKAGFDGVGSLGNGVKAFYVGACAAPSIVASVDAADTEGAMFNVEGPIERSNPGADLQLYTAVVQAYGDGLDPIGAGTVSFRSFMNLYVVLRELGADNLTPASITNAFRDKEDAPSFMGHPYTCDGKQFGDLIAMCSPQQILGEMHDRELSQVGTWIDVGAVYAAAR